MHFGHYQGSSEPGLEQLRRTCTYLELALCFFIPDDSSPLFRCKVMRLPSSFCLFTRKTPSANAYKSFISNLVLAKPGTLSKCLGKLLLFARLLTGHIVRGHVAIITKPSPHYDLPSRLPSSFCLFTRKTPSANAYKSFISNLVLAKPGTLSKCLGKLLLFARLLTGHIVRGHVAIITKPSPHYDLPSPPFPIVM